MSETRSEVRQGAYYDSVVLMQLQRSLADLPGVEDAGVVMATPANCDILNASGLSVDAAAGSEDLLIVVRAIDSETAHEALVQVDELLARRRSSTSFLIPNGFLYRFQDDMLPELPVMLYPLVEMFFSLAITCLWKMRLS